MKSYIKVKRKPKCPYAAVKPDVPDYCDCSENPCVQENCETYKEYLEEIENE